MNGEAEDLWVFGYGSLMWEPGFDFAERRHARLFGYHRALCLLSICNRGTVARPGLVVALDRGGSCHGIAFRIAAENAAATRVYLWEREMVTNAYRPLNVPIVLADRRRVHALTFASRAGHRQYHRPTCLHEAARLVAQGRGTMGTSLDYLRNIVRHLDELGITDGPMHAVLALAATLAQGREPAAETG